jgi:diaminopimelate decarboxylase
MTLSDQLPSLRSSIPPRLEPGLWPITAHATGRRDLLLGGVPLSEIVAMYGTATYVLDEEDVRHRCRDYRHAFYDGEVAYASKAFLNRAMARWVADEALSLDLCSAGELAIAASANFPADRIILHGNVKTPADLHAAIDYRVGRIVLDSMSEIARVAALSPGRQRVLLRITPNVDIGGLPAVATGIDDQKFGFPIGDGIAMDAARRVLAQSALALAGLHCHIGSQVTKIEAYEAAVGRLLDLIVEIRRQYGHTIGELNIGGGHAIAYQRGDSTLDIGELATRLRWLVRDRSRTLRIPAPRLTVEPGRGIVGRAMVAVYRVGAVKRSAGRRTWISIDGGMSDNLRPALYGAHYAVRLVGRATTAADEVVTVVGRHCEAGDILVRDVSLPADVRPGDLLAVPTAGAYQLSMSSNYNGALRPPVVAVYAGQARLVTRRETEQDLLIRDVAT